jgi:hypothetical protein
MSVITKAVQDVRERASVAAGAAAGAGAGAAISAGVGLAEKALAQIHAGAKFSGRVVFDLPGPFDPVVDVEMEVRLDDAHFRIKELHIKPSLP